MAFSGFTLAKTINESTMYRPTNIAAANLAGDSVLAAGREMDQAVMCEAAEYFELVANCDDMLAEAAMTNPARFMSLQEGVFGTIVEKVKAFFKKLIEMVKGVIEKLKAAFYKMTNQTGKWVTLMEPKIKKAAGESGSSDVTYEMHEYKEDFVLKGLSSKFSGINAAWSKDADWQDIGKGVIEREMKNIKTAAEKNAASYAGRTYDDEPAPGGSGTNRQELDNVIEPLNKERDNWKDKLDDFKKDFPSTLAGLVGVSGTTMDAVETAIYREARGAEKKEYKFGSKATSMLETVRNSKDTISRLKDEYEKHGKDLERIKTELDKVGTDFEPKPADKKSIVPGEVMSAAREAYTARFNHLTGVTQEYETALGKVRQINITLVNNMVSEYMSALSKFASFKAEKKK